jgi:DNA-directed RNA polymerase specialized sigma24 family protein
MNPLFKNVPVLSKDQEDSLLEKYRGGDSESGGILVHAHAPWIDRVIGTLAIPKWISRDDLFSDIMPDVLSALRTYDRSKGTTLRTYLYVAIARSAVKASKQYETVGDLEGQDIAAPDENVCDVIGLIGSLVAAIPDEEINETGRKLISRMLKGYDIEEIASQMGWTVADTTRMVKQTRLFIAYIMVRGGHSASPWIDDDTLSSMAEEYLRHTEGWF